MNSVGINGLNRSYCTNLLYGESSGDLFLISRLFFYAVNEFNTGDDIGQQIAKKQDRLDTHLKRSILAPRLLVIDEIGYLPFGRAEANLFFNVITNRYEVSSVIVTSNLPFSQ